ncbi:hypothetical protein HY641_00705 [Candidatus Woesearchaeota archaeon]|nr:hypothetical protein [Candidatus Woesearchaeota archaeon]
MRYSKSLFPYLLAASLAAQPCKASVGPTPGTAALDVTVQPRTDIQVGGDLGTLMRHFQADFRKEIYTTIKDAFWMGGFLRVPADCEMVEVGDVLLPILKNGDSYPSFARDLNLPIEPTSKVWNQTAYKSIVEQAMDCEHTWLRDKANRFTNGVLMMPAPDDPFFTATLLHDRGARVTIMSPIDFYDIATEQKYRVQNIPFEVRAPVGKILTSLDQVLQGMLPDPDVTHWKEPFKAMELHHLRYGGIELRYLVRP